MSGVLYLTVAEDGSQLQIDLSKYFGCQSQNFDENSLGRYVTLVNYLDAHGNRSHAYVQESPNDIATQTSNLLKAVDTDTIQRQTETQRWLHAALNGWSPT
jgi:hypothetical protein